jgi:hypothetical protein
MTSRTNLKAHDADNIKFIGGISLTSDESKKIVEECEITEKNELIRPSGLVYYEDQRKTLSDMPERAKLSCISCHSIVQKSDKFQWLGRSEGGFGSNGKNQKNHPYYWGREN